MVTKGLGCDVNIENRKNISRDSLTYSKSSTVVIAFCGPHTSEPSTRTYCVRLNPPEERWILVQGDIYFVNFDFLLLGTDSRKQVYKLETQWWSNLDSTFFDYI